MHIEKEKRKNSQIIDKDTKPIKEDYKNKENNDDDIIQSQLSEKEDIPVEILLFDNSQELSSQTHDPIQLNKLSVKELKELCKKSGYKGYSKMNKKEVIEFILDNQNK